MTKRKKKG